MAAKRKTAAKKEKKAEAAVSKYAAAAAELNKPVAEGGLGLSPALPVTGDDGIIQKEIRALKADNLIQPGDEFSPATEAVLVELGVRTAPAAAGKKGEAPAKATGKSKGNAPAAKGKGIGAFVRQILSTKAGWGRKNDEIATEAASHFGSRTNAACVAWYRMDMKRKDIAPKGV